jgi:hypothetical protein
MGPDTQDVSSTSGGVPASPMATIGAGPDISELIKNISEPLSPDLVRAATTPQVGPHAVQVPSSLTTSIAPHQQTPMMDPNQAVGRGYGKAVGIGNAIIGATNALGTVVTKEKQMKQGQIRDAAQKVIMAQQAIDEATNQRDAATKVGDAAGAAQFQKMIEQNTQVRDGVFADPKMRKSLVKGFDISYTDPESNKTEEHQAVMAAIKNAKTMQEKKQAIADFRQKQNTAAGAGAGAAFAAQQPRGFQPNQVAQAQLQIAQAQKKDLVDMYKTLAPALVRADSAQRIAATQAMTRLLEQQNALTQRTFERNQTFQQRLQLMDKQQQFEMKKLFTDNALIIGREQQRLKDMATDPNRVMQMSDESDRTWSSAIAAQQTALDTAQQNLDALRANKAASPQMIQQAQASVDARTQALDNTKDQASYYHNFYDAKRKILGMGSEEQDSSGDGSGSDSDSTGKSDNDSSTDNNSLSTWASPQTNDGWNLNAVP